MDITLRPVEKGDIGKIFEWRNHPAVRKNMFSTAPITKEENAAFWEKRLADRSAFSFIVSAGGADAGMVRLDRREGSYEVGVLIDPKMQGKGIGSGALALTIILARGNGMKKLTARIKEGNEASMQAFEKNGFVKKGQHYELDL
ncbi:MAG: GNAT family N-acetyltransferase [Candidatus ainarchaeum sp.]|nr:GNAT family N-acetyltransferase [Candidatus ainarchaeum sp.]